MASELTKKQLAALNDLSRDTLLDIVQTLVREYKPARDTLVNGWLSAPDDVLKRLEKAYDREANGRHFYDYYEADGFFVSLERDIVLPLGKLIPNHFLRVEALAARMILDFEHLSQQVDTSSGSWMAYLSALFEVWMASLAQQKEASPAVIAGKIYAVAMEDQWFVFERLADWRSELGTETLRALRDLLLNDGHVGEAFTLCLAIRDVAGAKALFERGGINDVNAVLQLCSLLMDELRTPEAITILQALQRDTREWMLPKKEWATLLVNALLEEGRKEEARQVAEDTFRKVPDACFWRLFLKSGGDAERDFSRFLTTAIAFGFEHTVQFLSDLERYALVNALITGKSEYSLVLPDGIQGSFWRTLSSTLKKHGFYSGAILLRRRLAESSISTASSRYYSSAASDAKQAIDYARAAGEAGWREETLGWLQALHREHFRKYALWKVMQEKIGGLQVTKQGVTLAG
ncbi:hypothetical protein EFS38_06105 [Dickeya undicola]|uniref:Zorya protein ZorC EH domain-containing protein n=1 Tax=Dickeya undicola TaxID=1577887 RepID=A0ABX9WYR5_9GAMM|nr:DUF6880 family protein [Dickeya undicola]RNM25492.1 hypothetical protein EFS38_06105 [Dickeya undicola]